MISIFTEVRVVGEKKTCLLAGTNKGVRNFQSCHQNVTLKFQGGKLILIPGFTVDLVVNAKKTRQALTMA